MTEPVSVSRRINAPAAVVFAILADPANHPRIDGSHMVQEATGDGAVTAAGAAFGMRMHNNEMGDYEMLNYVVEYEPDSRIGWEPVLAKAGRPEDEPGVGDRTGHRWSYLLTPDGQATIVTESYDCSQAPDWLRRAVRDGERWRNSMTRTLENLDALATGAAG
jgi:uncharacterized protein YndB with AHSA1/START domain